MSVCNLCVDFKYIVKMTYLWRGIHLCGMIHIILQENRGM